MTLCKLQSFKERKTLIMVFFTRIIFARLYNPKFIDKIRINVRGGTGGNGIPTLGGCGGNGGDVYVVASADHSMSLKNFKDSHPTKRFAADTGESSRRQALNGLKGASIYIQVPRGITLTDADTNMYLGEILSPSDKVCVARGGRGGCRRTRFHPHKGERRNLNLDLKIIADVGFVGFPNAGKSTLLRALSKAKPEVSAFPFTTVKPEVGILHFNDFRKIQLADLPGLIEGSFMNKFKTYTKWIQCLEKLYKLSSCKSKGRGHSFLKHIERTSLFMFVVDVTGFQLSPSSEFRNAFETVQLLVKELELYDESLLGNQAILVVNKMDVEGSDQLFGELQHQMNNYEDYVNDLPKNRVPKYPMSFMDIIPISAKEGTGVAELRLKIRQILDGRSLIHDKDSLPLNDSPPSLPDKTSRYSDSRIRTLIV